MLMLIGVKNAEYCSRGQNHYKKLEAAIGSRMWVRFTPGYGSKWGCFYGLCKKLPHVKPWLTLASDAFLQ
jgi:hypothetical protein